MADRGLIACPCPCHRYTPGLGGPMGKDVQGACKSCGGTGKARKPGVWIACPGGCGAFWCTVHNAHAHECDCPEIDDWGTVDPYAPGARE